MVACTHRLTTERNPMPTDTTDERPHPAYFVSTFYRFQKDENPEKTKLYLENLAIETDTRGLIIIGAEGFNATVCSRTLESLENFKQKTREYYSAPELFFKDSTSDVAP